jgi:hypothetical protein
MTTPTDPSSDPVISMFDRIEAAKLVEVAAERDAVVAGAALGCAEAGS